MVSQFQLIPNYLSMKSSMPIVLVIGCGLLVLLSACSNTSSTGTATSSASPAATPTSSEQAHAPRPGGTAVESGGIHLELVPVKEANQTHLDLFVQRSDNHASIPTAQVSAQVQTPDGQTQTVPMKYDATDKHFAGNLAGATKGQYQVKVVAVVAGKTVDGRFSFER
jgi:hypothetical protein